MCLSEELNTHSKEFEYQKSEFFVDEEDEDDTDMVTGDYDDDDTPPPPHPSLNFR
jgi:hypothetical protein